MRAPVKARWFLCALFLAAMALLLTAQTGFPQKGAADEVLARDAEYRAAVLRGDGGKLADIFADDIIIVHSDGTTDTGANFIDAVSSGRLKLNTYERSRVVVRIYGTVALLYSRTVRTFTYRGSPATDDDTSLVTWSKAGNRWRIVAMQNTHRGE
jgi:uncharacterized protein (TIGR02246 family)